MTDIPGASRLQAAHDANAARLAAADRAALNRLVHGYGAAWRDLQRQLVANLERIQRAQGRDGIVTLPMVLADQRLRALLDQAQAEIHRLGRLGADITTELQATGAEKGIEDSALAMRRAWRDSLSGILDPVTRRALADLPAWATINKSALEDLYGFTADGSPLAELFDKIGPTARAGWEGALSQGIIQGLNAREVGARAARATATAMARSMVIARTELLRAYRTASHRNYDVNSDILDGWIWISAANSRTCAACFGLHGTFHKLSERMSSHPQCRCAPAPHTRSLVDILGPDGAAQLHLAGYDPADVDTRIRVPAGETLFQNLPEGAQLAVLGGPGALAAYQAGQVHLVDFVGLRRSADWGASHYQRSLRGALAAAEVRRQRGPVPPATPDPMGPLRPYTGRGRPPGTPPAPGPAGPTTPPGTPPAGPTPPAGTPPKKPRAPRTRKLDATGAPMPRKPRARKPAAAPPAGDDRTEVRDGLKVPANHLGLDRVLDAIAKVHTDGPLPVIPVRIKPAGTMSANGQFVSMPSFRRGPGTVGWGGGGPDEIRINGNTAYATTPHLTFAHEIGHYLDNAGIGRKKKTDDYQRDGNWPTQRAAQANIHWTPTEDKAEAAMNAVMGALMKSRAATELRDYARQAAAKGYIEIPRRMPEGMQMGSTNKPLPPYQYQATPSWFKYAHSDLELWARGYAQYIAVRSGDLTMMAQLRAQQAKYVDAKRGGDLAIPHQWEDDDFEPIAQAIDGLFTALGWKK